MRVAHDALRSMPWSLRTSETANLADSQASVTLLTAASFFHDTEWNASLTLTQLVQNPARSDGRLQVGIGGRSGESVPRPIHLRWVSVTHVSQRLDLRVSETRDTT